MVAPRAKIFAVGAVEVALHGHVINCQPWQKREIAAFELDGVLEIREHGLDYKTRCQNQACSSVWD
jgi:hypothetical protein